MACIYWKRLCVSLLLSPGLPRHAAARICSAGERLVPPRKWSLYREVIENEACLDSSFIELEKIVYLKSVWSSQDLYVVCFFRARMNGVVCVVSVLRLVSQL